MPASRPVSPARRSTAKREAFDVGDVPLDAPCGHARTNAGGVVGREALDAATVASRASIKAGDRSEQSLVPMLKDTPNRPIEIPSLMPIKILGSR
jgi:hypothetical protein